MTDIKRVRGISETEYVSDTEMTSLTKQTDPVSQLATDRLQVRQEEMRHSPRSLAGRIKHYCSELIKNLFAKLSDLYEKHFPQKWIFKGGSYTYPKSVRDELNWPRPDELDFYGKKVVYKDPSGNQFLITGPFKTGKFAPGPGDIVKVENITTGKSYQGTLVNGKPWTGLEKQKQADGSIKITSYTRGNRDIEPELFSIPFDESLYGNPEVKFLGKLKDGMVQKEGQLILTGYNMVLSGSFDRGYLDIKKPVTIGYISAKGTEEKTEVKWTQDEGFDWDAMEIILKHEKEEDIEDKATVDKIIKWIQANSILEKIEHPRLLKTY